MFPIFLPGIDGSARDARRGVTTLSIVNGKIVGHRSSSSNEDDDDGEDEQDNEEEEERERAPSKKAKQDSKKAEQELKVRLFLYRQYSNNRLHMNRVQTG